MGALSIATWVMSVNGFFDTQLRQLHPAASTATSSLASGRILGLELALSGVNQMDPAYVVNLFLVIAWTLEV